jgi:DNA invertase Pin-like site-specific DNA recombinase
MIAAYLRVSSRSQDVAMQRAAITRAAKARGERIGSWYAEQASSVAQSRPELTRLREDVRGGRVAKLWVFRLDRLSRGGILEVLNIVHELRDHGCRLETVSDGFSFDGPAADVILAVFAWVAEMERAAIRARLKDARTALEASGGHWGRPRKVDKLMGVRIQDLKGKGRTIRSIAMAVKIPRTSVARWLSQNPPPKPRAKSATKSVRHVSRK